MANLVELVKQAALDAVSAAHPTQVVFGKVTALDPLEVRIHQQLLLTREFLVLSENIRTKAAQGTLHAGNTLLLLQQQGGQSFLALDILPGADWELPPEEPVTWADIAEKPEVFPPAAHAHTAQEVGAAEVSHTHSAAEIASGTLPLAHGGTGAATAADARANLGISYANLGTVPIANGGTGNISGMAVSVADYNAASATPIKIGYAGSGLTTCTHFAAYSTDSEGTRVIKDIAVANARTAMGALGATSNGTYYGMGRPDGNFTDWIRTSEYGIIPYKSGGASALGTSSWPFNNIYANNHYGSWAGNTIAIAKGGTGATTAAAARSNLGITYANIGTVPVANGGTGGTTAQAARTNLGMSGTPMYALWSGTNNLTSQLTVSGICANPGYNTLIFIFQEGSYNFRQQVVIPVSYLGTSKSVIFGVNDSGTGSNKRFYAWKSGNDLILEGYNYTGSGGSLRNIYGRY